MSLMRSKLNQIERKIMSIKDEIDNTIEVPTGVHYADENGDIIEGGPVTRVPREDENKYGVLLVPAPIDKDDWPKVVKKCEEYQESLRSQIEQDLS